MNPRLVTNVITAFVDRNAVEWLALRSRATSEVDHGLLDVIARLAALRATVDSIHTRPSHPSLVFVCLVAALAGIQSISCLVIVGIAYIHNDAPATRLPQVALASGFIAASIFLGVRASHDPRVLSLSAWFALASSPFARLALMGLPSSSMPSIDVVVRGLAPDAFMPACLWQFSSDFPRAVRFTRFDSIAGRATALAWMLGIGLFVGDFATSYGLINAAKMSSALGGHSGSIYWQITTLAMMPAVLAIFLRSRQAPPRERRRVARLASAIAVGTGPFFLMAVVVTIVPAANTWLMTAKPGNRLWLDLMVLGGLVATPILAILAVVVDQPFPLRPVCQPSSLYLLARGFLVAFTLSPFALLAVFLYQQRHTSMAALLSGPSVAPLLFCAAVGSFLMTIRPRMLSALDRYVSRRTADHQQQLARAIERVRLSRSLRENAVVLRRELQRGIGATSVSVLPANSSSCSFDTLTASIALPAESGLLAILREVTGPLDVSPDGELRQLLPVEESEWLSANNVALAMPLKHRDDSLAAVVLVSPKRGNLPFDDRDLWLLTTLATAAAAMWDETKVSSPGHGPLLSTTSVDSRSSEPAFECQSCGVVGDSTPLSCDCGVPPSLAALPERFDHSFVVQRRLGAGGMGVVYRARDLRLGREVALKTLPALKPGSIARLRDEARAMAALNHQSLATIFDFHVWRRTPVLVVEYLPNGTLAHRLAKGPSIAEETVILGIALARALVYMHAQGVLHRDLKPSNVGFTATGAPKLLDFGLAALVEPAHLDLNDEPRSLGGSLVGTRAYLPPEAFHGATPTAAFDLWALSLILLEALTGVNPCADGHGNPATLRAMQSVVPSFIADTQIRSPAMRAFFERALNHEPSRRFATASELLCALETLPR